MNVGKRIFCFLFSMSTFIVNAQKEGNVWTFPHQLGINFNDTINPAIFTSAIGPGVGFPGLNQTTIADTAGNLFCYAAAIDYTSSGLYVFDRNHSVMPHGSHLKGHPIMNSMLVPYPGIDSLILLFQIAEVGSSYYGLYYSIIDKNLNNGLGDLILKDSLIYSNGIISDSKLAACKHANGRDWWLCIYDYSSSAYVTFILSPFGISFGSSQQLGSTNDGIVIGKLLFSNDGTKLMSVGTGANGAGGCIDVFDFVSIIHQSFTIPINNFSYLSDRFRFDR